MNSRSSNSFRFSLAVLDMFALNSIHFVLLFVMNKVQDSKQFIILFIAANFFWLICAYVNALYIGTYSEDVRIFKRTLQSFLMYTAVTLLFIFLYRYNYSRLFIMLSFGGFGGWVIASRTAFTSASYFLRKRGKFNKRVVILGNNDLSIQLANIYTKYSSNIIVDGLFEDAAPVHSNGTSFPILGKISDSLQYAIDNDIREIISTISPEKNQHLYQLAQHAEMNFIRFKFVPDFRIFVNRKIHIDFAREIPILSFRPEPLEDIGSRIKKRSFDIFFSSIIILLVLSWLIPIIGLLIKLDSRGPVFFKQLRSGKNNLPFLCYKFRSLRVNDESDEIQVTRNDNRFTSLGKFLRKSNLDELPQFFNVFQGYMSVVGPRPHMLKHTDEYSQVFDEYMVRHYVKPGVTGWAQVHGYRGEIKEEEQLRKRIEFDIWYMENWSMWLDLQVIFLTIYRTVKGDKNAF